MNINFIIGLIACGIAGGIAGYFGGLWGILAITLAQIGMNVLFSSDKNPLNH